MQALAAEDVDMKPRIAKSGAIQPLVTMVKTGLPLSCQACQALLWHAAMHMSLVPAGGQHCAYGVESISTAIFVIVLNA